jgi:uncharacterized Zn-binding protein involved in type VI secretion
VLQQGSGNVITNGSPTGRVGDTYGKHCCPVKKTKTVGSGKDKKTITYIVMMCHTGNAAKGHPTVLTNGRPTHRKGDAVSCGGTAATGSGNVIAG